MLGPSRLRGISALLVQALTPSDLRRWADSDRQEYPVVGRTQTGRSTAGLACCSWCSCQRRPDKSLEKDPTHPSIPVQVQVPTELHLCEDLTEQEYCKARLLQPAGLAAYAAQRARMQSQAPAAAKEEPDLAAESAAGAAPGGIEGASGVVKSEPSDGAVAGRVNRTAAGTLGRVKVPKGGFSK